MTIKLTLICPVYKVGQYIPELMKSLLAGVNSEEVEIIFVDDCCPENSIAVCEDFLKQHEDEILFKRQVIKLEKNIGLSGARNQALKVAKGSYIGFIDSDDAIADSYWQILAPYINKGDQDIIEFSFKEFTNELPKTINSDALVVNELPSSNLNPFYTGFFVWIRLYRKELIKDILFPEGKIYEDMFYNIHSFARSQSSIRLDACLVYYRKREGSTTALRTSQYSHLLINLITAVQQVIKDSSNQREMISLLQKRTFILMLKGLKIPDKQEKKKYFALCWPKLLEITQLVRLYQSDSKAKILYIFAELICRIMK